MSVVRAIVGLDVGGANLKASDGERIALSRPFALWRQPDRLPAEIRELLEHFPGDGPVAVTMTGELADCFTTKSEGVGRILAAVAEACGDREIAVWQTSGEFCGVDEALESVPLVAAGNWHALASWAARMVPRGTGLLIDIGSTTTDIIPLHDGIPVPQGRTDRERMISGELVYSGVRRTPLCAVTSQVPVGKMLCPVAAEQFATTLDLYLLSGDIEPNGDDRGTANGKPATRACARDRICRSVCCDRTELSEGEIMGITSYCREAQHNQILRALQGVSARLSPAPETILLGGEGEFLARRIVDELKLAGGVPACEVLACEVLSLSRLLGPSHSAAACAFALANLLRERNAC